MTAIEKKIAEYKASKSNGTTSPVADAKPTGTKAEPVAKTFATKEDVLKALAASKITVVDAAKALKQFEAPAKPGTLSCKVSEKGAISVYGLQRMPVTLYAEQWERLLKFGPSITGFMADHIDELKFKE